MSKEQINFENQRPKITRHVNRNEQIKLVFKDRTNTTYEVVKERVEIENGESYKQVLAQLLDPNVNKELKYGVATRLEPKTKTFMDLKESINNKLNTKLNEMKQQHEQTQQQTQEQQQEQIITNGGEQNDKQQ